VCSRPAGRISSDAERGGGGDGETGNGKGETGRARVRRAAVVERAGRSRRTVGRAAAPARARGATRRAARPSPPRATNPRAGAGVVLLARSTADAAGGGTVGGHPHAIKRETFPVTIAPPDRSPRRRRLQPRAGQPRP